MTMGIQQATDQNSQSHELKAAEKISPPSPTTSENELKITDDTTVGLYISRAIDARHSTRAFKPDPVPAHVIEECLAHAQHSPSNSNLQPWRITIVSGAALKRLSEGLLAANNDPSVKPQIEPIPEEYRHHRSDLGHSLYGAEGYNVPRGAKEELTRVRNRNYEFFGAPMGIIVCIDAALADVDILSAGLYLQTLCLLFQERGIGSCIEVSVAGYPDAIRKETGIPANMRVLCGVAVGYEDDAQQVNRLKAKRDAWKQSVNFVTE